LVKIVDQEKDVVLGESERRPITLIETDQWYTLFLRNLNEFSFMLRRTTIAF
jgi:hypothetical protein